MAGMMSDQPDAGTGHFALLLAAGGSTRLGRPKQLLTRNGVPLMRRMAEAALATQPLQLHVVIGAQAAAMREALDGLPVRVLENVNWRSGLASSLQLAACNVPATSGRLLVLACDQPQLGADQLQQLLAAPVAESTVVATDYGADVGIPVVMPLSLLQQANRLQGDSGLKRLWQARSLHRIHLPELAWDVDTPADLQQAIANGWLDAD
ncbi:MAG TPA: nucleotidyltransferase family protein [Permianibacter sp.]|nr:nucleotidyltransferase family protein [Permianibacter sp.]